MPEHILIVDDDADIREVVRLQLEQEGFEVSETGSGAGLRRAVSNREIDLVILDLMLPDEDGLSLARFLKENSDAGIVMLTGKGDSVDLVVGLEVGADDYVAKPFNSRELLARIRSVLRRTKAAPRSDRRSAVVDFEGWKLDGPYQRLIDPNGHELTLTTAEARLMQALVAKAGTPVSRQDLHRSIYGRDLDADSRSIDVLVGRLRRKVEPGRKNAKFIRSVRGVGYVFTANILPS